MATDNLDFSLIKRLTRIFSGPITRRSGNTVQKVKRRYFNKFNFQITPWNFSGFANFQKDNYRWFDHAHQESLAERDRIVRYREFSMMETMPEISKALDIYADESTTSTHLQDILKIESTDSHIKEVLHRLFYETLDVKNNLWGWTRQMCKFGDYFLLLQLDDNMGVVFTMGLPEGEVRRVEGLDPGNPDYVKFRWEGQTGAAEFENFQVAHFRIAGNERNFPYGVSVLEPARRIYRQLSMQEDVMMAYRVARSPERRAFYIDVEGVPPEAIPNYFENMRSNLRSNQIINSDTGEVHKRYNPWSVEDDLFIMVRGQADKTRIETLPGGQYVGVIDDIKYLRNKLFCSLGVPSSYLEDKEGAEDKDSLTQKDVRFAATIGRIQSYIIAGLEKIAEIHLMILGYRGEDIVNFKLSLNIPSKIWELQELEFWGSKLDVAASAEGKLSREFIYKKMFGLTDDEIRYNMLQLYGDAKFMGKLEALKVGPAGAAGSMGGLGGDLGGMGGDLGGLGGDLGGMGGDLGGDLGGVGAGEDMLGAGGPAEAEPPTDGSLLAIPGRSRENNRAWGAQQHQGIGDDGHGENAPPVGHDRRKGPVYGQGATNRRNRTSLPDPFGGHHLVAESMPIWEKLAFIAQSIEDVSESPDNE
jgi:hypothetical protein